MNLKITKYMKIRLTESKLKQIVAESVRKVLKEHQQTDYICTTNVECYDSKGDIVFVCVPFESDGKAVSFCNQKLGLEPISCSNGWSWKRGYETYNEHNLLDRGYCILDRPAQSEDDLDWYN